MAKPIIFDILAVDEASRTFTKVGLAAGGMATKVESAGKVASKGFLYAGVAAGALAVHSIKMAGDFDAAIVRLETTAGESKAALGTVSDGLLNMAGKVGYTAQELAKGMYTVESAGYHGAAGLKVMEAAAKGARVEGADLTATTDAVSSLLVDYHLSANDAAKATNVLTAAVGHGKTTFEQLATALPNVAAAGATANISMEELASAIATMTMHGTDASKAGTYLRQVIGQLEAPSAKASKIMGQLGIDSNKLGMELSSGSGHGLADAIQMVDDAIRNHLAPSGLVALDTFTKSKKPLSDYKKVLADLPDDYITSFGALSKMVGGVKSLQGFLQLGGENLKTYRSNVQAVREQVRAGGKDVEGYAEQQKTLNGRLADAEGAASAFSVKLGRDLEPAAKAVVGVVIELTGVLSEHDKAAAGVVVVLTGVAGALAAVKVASAAAAVTTSLLGGAEVVLALQMGAAALATGDMAGAVAGLTLAIEANPIGLIAVGVTAAAAALFGLHKILHKTHDAFQDTITPTVDFAKSLDQVTGAATKETRALAFSDLQKRGAIKTGNMLKISNRDLVSASLGNEAAIKRVTAAITAYDKKYAAGTYTTNSFGQVVQATSTGADDLAIQLGLTAKKFEKQSAETRIAAAAVQTWAEALKGVPKSVQTELKTKNYDLSLRQVYALEQGYHLLPKQVTSVLQALGYDLTAKQLDDIINKAKTAGRQAPVVRVTADVAAARASLAALQSTLDRLINTPIHIGKPKKQPSGLGGLLNSPLDSNKPRTNGRGSSLAMHFPDPALAQGFMSSGDHLAAIFVNNIASGISNGKMKVATALDKMKNLLQTETTKLQNLLSAKNAVVQGFQGMTSSAFGQDFSATGGTSAAVLIDYQQKQLEAAMQLKADETTAISEGLSKAMVLQLANSGANGMANLHALVAGGPGAVSTLSALSAQTANALTAAGVTGGNYVYGSQIQAAQKDQATAQAIVRELTKWRRQEDKNTIVQLHIGPKIVQASLLELKRHNGNKPLGLS